MELRCTTRRCVVSLVAVLTLLALLSGACSGTQGAGPVSAPEATVAPKPVTAAPAAEQPAGWKVAAVEVSGSANPPPPTDLAETEAWQPLPPDTQLPGIGTLVPVYPALRDSVAKMSVGLKEELKANDLEINTARTVQAKEVSPDEKHYETVSVAPVLPSPAGVSSATSATWRKIIFETPSMDKDVFVDAATGVTFIAEPAGAGGEFVGTVQNNESYACVPPEDKDLKLGTGRRGDFDPGKGAFPIRATFPAPLAPPVTVTVEVQTLYGYAARIRLFDAAGAEVASNETKASEPGGVRGACGLGIDNGRMTLSATANEPVAYAILDQYDNQLFVIDNFAFSSPDNGVITGMLVLETNVEGGALKPGAYIQRSLVTGSSGKMSLVDASTEKEMLTIPLVVGPLIPGKLEVPQADGPIAIVVSGTKYCLTNIGHLLGLGELLGLEIWQCGQCNFWQPSSVGMEPEICRSYLDVGPAEEWKTVPVPTPDAAIDYKPLEPYEIEAWLPPRTDFVPPGGTLAPAFWALRDGLGTMHGSLVEELKANDLGINTARIVQAAEVGSLGGLHETVSIAPIVYRKGYQNYIGPRPQGRIDFETPWLDQDPFRIAGSYVDGSTGVTFAAEPMGWGDETVGVVRNDATYACVAPQDANQKLGTGRSGDSPDGEQGVLRGYFPIRATFPAPLAPPVTVAVEVQTLYEYAARIRLFNTAGVEVASNENKASEPGGVRGACGLGIDNGRMTLSATAYEPVAYAIVDQYDNQTFVIDNFAFASAQISKDILTGMLVLDTNVEASALLSGAYLLRSSVEGRSGTLYLVEVSSGEEKQKAPILAGRLRPGSVDLPDTEGPITFVIPGSGHCLNDSLGFWQCFPCSFRAGALDEDVTFSVCEGYLEQAP